MQGTAGAAQFRQCMRRCDRKAQHPTFVSPPPPPPTPHPPPTFLPLPSTHLATRASPLSEVMRRSMGVSGRPLQQVGRKGQLGTRRQSLDARARGWACQQQACWMLTGRPATTLAPRRRSHPEQGASALPTHPSPARCNLPDCLAAHLSSHFAPQLLFMRAQEVPARIRWSPCSHRRQHPRQ